MKKDDIVTLTIDDIGTNGEGIGRTEGITLFIKDALPGDMVRAKIMKMKKTYGYARLMEILKESADLKIQRSYQHLACRSLTATGTKHSFRWVMIKKATWWQAFLRPEPITLFRCRTAFWERKATEESCPLF